MSNKPAGTPSPSALGATITEGELALTDVTTANATAAAHGLLPKLSGVATDVFAGDGTYDASTGTGDNVRATSPTLVTPALGAAQATTIQTSGNVGFGVTPSATVGELLLAQTDADQVTKITVKNMNAAGTTAQAQVVVTGDTGSFTLVQHGSARVISRWGQALGGWAEILGNVASGEGMAIGTLGDRVFKLGTNSIAGMQFDGTNQHPSFPVSDKRVTTQFDAAGTTTLATVTELTVTVTAGKTYRFEAILHVTADATGGHKYAIAGTATATAVIYQINSINNATNAFRINSRQTALGGSSGEAMGTAYFTRIDGTITVNAAGTLLVQFAQNAATGTSSVLVGSTFTVVEVA